MHTFASSEIKDIYHGAAICNQSVAERKIVWSFFLMRFLIVIVIRYTGNRTKMAAAACGLFSVGVVSKD